MLVFGLECLALGTGIFYLYSNICTVNYYTNQEAIITWLVCVIIASLMVRLMIPIMVYMLKWVIIVSVALLVVGSMIKYIDSLKK